MSAKALARRLETLVPEAAAGTRPNALLPAPAAAPLPIRLAARQPSAASPRTCFCGGDHMVWRLTPHQRAIVEEIKKRATLTSDDEILTIAIGSLADRLDVPTEGDFDLPYRNSMSYLRLRLA